MFLAISSVAIGAAMAVHTGILGSAAPVVGLQGLLGFSVSFYLAGFLYVLMDRVVMERLLEQRLTRYPPSMLEHRQKTKSIVIPLFVSIMACIVCYSLVLAALAGTGLSAGTMGRVGNFVLVGGFAFQVLVAVLVVAWANNTSKLYGLLLERLGQIASDEKGLTGRVPVGSVDEIASMVGYINGFSDMVKADFTEIRSAYDRFHEIHRTLMGGVDTATEASLSISERIEGLERLIDRENGSVSGAIQTGNELSANFSTLVSTVREQNEGLRTTVSDTEAAIVSVKDATERSESVRAKVEELRRAFGQGGMDIRASRDSVRAVAELSRKLSDINTVIAKIASQTNLLAMNAAIEAAHAGEAGAGFSVVADEIRMLAEGTARQTKDSRASLAAVVSEVERALAVSERTASSFEAMDSAFADVGLQTTAVAESMKNQDRMNESVIRALRASSEAVAETERLAAALDAESSALADSLMTLERDARNTGENSAAMREANDLVKGSVSSLATLSGTANELNTRMAALMAGFRV